MQSVLSIFVSNSVLEKCYRHSITVLSMIEDTILTLTHLLILFYWKISTNRKSNSFPFPLLIYFLNSVYFFVAKSDLFTIQFQSNLHFLCTTFYLKKQKNFPHLLASFLFIFLDSIPSYCP